MDYNDAVQFVTATDEEKKAEQNQVIERKSFHPVRARRLTRRSSSR